MQKITLLFISIILSYFSFAQKAVNLLNEDFSSGVPPTGWTVDGMSSQWSQSSSSKAGGTAPEARLKYLSGTNTTYLISPEVDLTGLSTVIFSFKHFLDDYSGSGYTIGVATRSGGGSWNNVWTLIPTGDIGPETTELEISNADIGTADFQISIFLTGNTYNFDYWYIDDINLFAPDDNDAAMQSINISPYSAQGNTDIKCTFNNSGRNNITSADLNYQINNGTVVTENVTGINLSTTQTYDYTFTTPLNASPGNYTLKVWINNINGAGEDDDTSNDTTSLELHIATQSIDKTPLYEEFTSSTCSPCANFNSNFFTPTFLQNNAGNFTIIKYQMNWPSPGDSYYTAEGGVRQAYYGVSGVPTLFLDAQEGTFFNTSQLQTALDNANNIPAFFTLNATHQISGNTISIQADILPYIDAKDFNVQTAVVEKTTTGNIGNNGETEFHYVMMKMLPDAAGTKTTFSSGVHSYLSQTYDLSGTHVEDMNDLAVIVFIQNDKTKEIFQSGFSAENALPAPQVSFSPANGSINIDNETDIKISFNQYMRFIDNSEITNDNISTFVTVTDPSSNPIPFTAAINDSKSLITIIPDTYLPESSLITITVNNSQIEGINDVALPGKISSFTTELYPDANAVFSPSNGADNVDFNRNITITFDNPMRKIDDSEITDADIASFITLTDPSKGDIAFTGTINSEKTVITINPDMILPELTNITITTLGNKIENKYNKPLSETSAVFTTSAYPAANASFNPADGSENINYDTNITVTFDDAMKKTDDSEITDSNISSFLTLTDPSKGNIAFTGTINSDKTIITLDPDEALPGHTEITATITGNEIKNIYNKSLDATSATFTVGSGLGINDISEFAAINPNPANDFITVSGINNGQITITDISGKQVLSQNINSDFQTINIQNLPSGIYIIKIISSEQIATQKIIKK